MHRPTRTAFCTALTQSDTAAAPTEVQLIPAGPSVRGRDGRTWTFDGADAQVVITTFSAGGIPLVIDREHATQHRAPQGLDAPAAGWIESLNMRDGALWGQVQWTNSGQAQVAGREYRYLSPVFDYDPATGRIARLVSAGLTNLPNLHLQALNQEQAMERTTALIAAIAAAFSLPADATDDALATAINQLKTSSDAASARALNAESAQPALERYVPRADYDTVLARATNAEQALLDHKSQALKADAEAEIAAALKGGRIAPASAEHYRALCTDAAGLEGFRALVKTLPVIGAETNLGTRQPPNTDTALNAEERAICEATGVSTEAYLAARL